MIHSTALKPCLLRQKKGAAQYSFDCAQDAQKDAEPAEAHPEQTPAVLLSKAAGGASKGDYTVISNCIVARFFSAEKTEIEYFPINTCSKTTLPESVT